MGEENLLFEATVEQGKLGCGKRKTKNFGKLSTPAQVSGPGSRAQQGFPASRH
jgi:hypothetical protein